MTAGFKAYNGCRIGLWCHVQKSDIPTASSPSVAALRAWVLATIFFEQFYCFLFLSFFSDFHQRTWCHFWAAPTSVRATPAGIMGLYALWTGGNFLENSKNCNPLILSFPGNVKCFGKLKLSQPGCLPVEFIYSTYILFSKLD